jgi:hypothetical protein
MNTLILTFVRSEWLSVSEALKLEHLNFFCKLIVNGLEKDLYEIYVKGA